MMGKIPPRAERRARQRLEEKLARDRERLAKLEAGGSAVRPIDVESASQIEPHVLGLPCLRCGGPYRLDEHTAETLDGARVRVVRVHCGHCGAKRVVYFRIAPVLAS
jgi:hypothetical protein